MNIVELTLLDGSPVSINLGRVDYVQPSDDHTLIMFEEGREVVVREGYDTVAELWNPERQSGC